MAGERAEPDRQGLVRILRRFVEHGLTVDPVLANQTEHAGSFVAQQQIVDAAHGLSAEHWNPRTAAATFGALPLPEAAGERAAAGTLLSTAAAVASEQIGVPAVRPEHVHVAAGRFREFVAADGFGAAVRVYLAVAAVQDYSALRFYDRMSEDDFISGEWHRPWSVHSLRDELLAAVALGSVQLSVEEGERFVRLTEKGRAQLADLRAVLEESGFALRQHQLLTVSGFNAVNLEDLFREEAPDMTDLRRDFARFAALPPGSTVLECGAGAGDNLFEGGLAEAIGAGGRFIATDPAIAPLRRLGDRAERAGLRHISTLPAPAEALPLPDASVDAVVGTFFLQFTVLHQAIREALRVTRHGGTVAFAVFNSNPAIMAPWFKDWFRPLLDLAAAFGTPQTLPLHDPGVVSAALAAAGGADLRIERRVSRWVAASPQGTVAHALQAVNLFGATVEQLPWRAREELVQQLIARGTEICGRTNDQERTLLQPVEFVRCTKP